ncbi:hypothetical protein BXZ70DRAFT_1007728 [Cristinia sonorae]|uniref:Uncharacterized protein n=1 Tax=Cristinia sonorae TaxID=1940300 RepID=A0A8K0UQZ0_9AGAR|nr:hypothetical protein BXZ70DRAFT_1007728 [Cristinia sonorae]
MAKMACEVISNEGQVLPLAQTRSPQTSQEVQCITVTLRREDLNGPIYVPVAGLGVPLTFKFVFVVEPFGTPTPEGEEIFGKKRRRLHVYEDKGLLPYDEEYESTSDPGERELPDPRANNDRMSDVWTMMSPTEPESVDVPSMVLSASDNSEEGTSRSCNRDSEHTGLGSGEYAGAVVVPAELTIL